MALRVVNNVAAVNAQRNLNSTMNSMKVSLSRLSSGLRINNAADDAAGLSISQSFRADIAAYRQSNRNVAQATAMLQTAEGGLNQVHAMLTRLKELATQAASDNVESNRGDIDDEAQQLIDEIDRISGATEYAGTTMLDGYGKQTTYFASMDAGIQSGTIDITDYNIGSAEPGTYSFSVSGATLSITAVLNGATIQQSATVATGSTVEFSAFDISFDVSADADLAGVTGWFGGTGPMSITANGGTFQVGATNNTDNRLGFTIDAVSASDLGISTIQMTSLSSAQSAMDLIDSAIDEVNAVRSNIGANMNRLSYASANLEITLENAISSESVIRDADMAEEMSNFTKSQILQQAGTAMLSQANALPQAALSLLG